MFLLLSWSAFCYHYMKEFFILNSSFLSCLHSSLLASHNNRELCAGCIPSHVILCSGPYFVLLFFQASKILKFPFCSKQNGRVTKTINSNGGGCRVKFSKEQRYKTMCGLITWCCLSFSLSLPLFLYLSPWEFSNGQGCLLF